MAEMNEELLELETDGMYLTFSLDGESYGLGIGHVREIVGMQPITPLPQAPDYIKGVINLRGHILPIADMRMRFGRMEKPYDERTCIIVLDVQQTTMGLIVDRVSEVLSFTQGEIVPPPETRFSNRYIEGIGKSGETMILLLDCSKLFGDTDFSDF